MGSKASDILSWVEQSMEEENFLKQEIVLAGTTGKTDGYSSDIVFAKVTGVDAAGNNKEVNLAVKIGKQNAALREQLSMIGDCYKREIAIYSSVFPAFQCFQQEKNITDSFDSIPKCYKTFLTDTAEVIVLEDLRIKGFKLHDRCEPMNLQHIKLVLSSYAKFHAISFAFRDQKAVEYNALTANFDRLYIKLVRQYAEGFNNAPLKVVQHLKDASREDLVAEYEKVVKRFSLLDILEDEVKHSVITHGDCHNNNFLFRYENNDKENPIDIAILDWQGSTHHSPAMDLSSFLYAVAGEQIYQLPELLEFYHSNLTRFAKDMGTDLKKIYPFTSLLEDWRKYSYFGFAFITTFLHVMLVQEHDAPSFDDVQEGQNPMELMFSSRQLDNRDEYWKRLIQVVDQYCNQKI